MTLPARREQQRILKDEIMAGLSVMHHSIILKLVLPLSLSRAALVPLVQCLSEER